MIDVVSPLFGDALGELSHRSEAENCDLHGNLIVLLFRTNARILSLNTKEPGPNFSKASP